MNGRNKEIRVDNEDALLMMSSKRTNAAYIATRNIDDYKHSPIKALEPGDIVKAIS